MLCLPFRNDGQPPFKLSYNLVCSPLELRCCRQITILLIYWGVVFLHKQIALATACTVDTDVWSVVYIIFVFRKSLWETMDFSPPIALWPNNSIAYLCVLKSTIGKYDYCSEYRCMPGDKVLHEKRQTWTNSCSCKLAPMTSWSEISETVIRWLYFSGCRARLAEPKLATTTHSK